MNRGRPRYDDILTPREWEVLDLIEAGLTNEQIAERLGISFGTAKYHVAEIISKLGVERREHAPAAARRARVPAVPLWPLGWLRARVSLPALAGAAVVAALLLLSAVVFTDVLSDPSTSAPEGDLTDAAADFQPGDASSQADILARAPAELSSFYYELVVTSRTMRDEAMRQTLQFKVWHQAPDEWRVEWFDANSELRTITIADGETFWRANWRMDRPEVTYSREPIEPGVNDRANAPHAFGPVEAENLNALMEAESDGPAHYWEVQDEREAILGIDALRLVQVCCRSGAVDQRMGEQWWWIDPTYNFLLRLEERSPGPGGLSIYEMTDIQYNPDLDESLFVFEPPEGAVEVRPP
jgi:DNA-binding CsgD family transcriptional regulator/outer membrane lipoprotein-sorting protein